MTDWHDDFEPNTQAKQNRGSIWTYTITLLSSAHVLNQSSYSYVIAIGPKNANHDNVLDTIRKEIKCLQQHTISIYHRVLDSMIPVRLFHLLSIADSPEHRSKNYISLGSGLYSGR